VVKTCPSRTAIKRNRGERITTPPPLSEYDMENWKRFTRKKNPRTEYSAAWARKKREELIELLGGKCHKCGSKNKLEFHHKYVREWVAAKKSRWQRMVLYRREYDAGEIELSCRHCNARDGKPKNFSPRVLNTYEEEAA
jgi:hypothetical protein